MNIALWVAAGLLAVVYLAAGLPKLTKPKEALEGSPSSSRSQAPVISSTTAAPGDDKWL